MLKQISIDSKDCKEKVLKYIIKYPIIIQLPTVYGIIALPNSKGVHDLNKIKNRKPNKNYGSIVGDLNNFYDLFKKEKLPDFIQNINNLNVFNDCFIRGIISSTNKNNSVIKNGTHQGLILRNKKLRDLITAIEINLSYLIDIDLFDGNEYMAPLCTSANISGDPKGSIVNKKDAILFAKERDIKLMVTLKKEDIANELGSYPILSLNKHQINLVRNGPGDQQLLKLIPKELRGLSFI